MGKKNFIAVVTPITNRLKRFPPVPHYDAMDRRYLLSLANAASTMAVVPATEMSSPIFGGGCLQSRVFQREGMWVYEYRLDLRDAQTSVGLSTGPTDQAFVVSASYVSSAPPQVVTATVATSNGNVEVNAYAPKW